MGNLITARWIIWIVPFLWIQAYAQKPESIQLPIESILGDDVIDAILSASNVSLSRLDSGSIATEPQFVNAVKTILLDERTYVTGVKRSCQFIPRSVFKFDSSSDHTCNVSFSGIYCPKIQIEVGGQTMFLDLSEKGAKRISELLYSPQQTKGQDDDTRVQILVFSYLLERQDTGLIADLHDNKFFNNILPVIKRSGRRPMYYMQLDQQSRQVFEKLQEAFLVTPLQKKISSGEVKVSKTGRSH